MTVANKTGRRWCFVLVGIADGYRLEEALRKEKRVRYATWYLIKKERVDARGYIELRTPLKQTGIRKILGDTSIVCFAKREREEIINDVEKNRNKHNELFNYGERELNKGGRPRKRKPVKGEKPSNSFFVLSSCILTKK
ncbi:hypothetical protein NEMIN01_0335 [Nematocida minor]|uniref:uncharacterized protein n=1 Tax=Nematocida minor TaxID=1912983 RepID=UPI00221F88EE|nr:uncharacterized protein NEMIN01_0335 [Nematocida minor]KAI5189169.1 hypothetical protein NEMIN01_0335 [Nematocida minor]